MARTLGQIIRAARLGWYEAPAMRAWLRMCDLSPTRILVEVAPIGDQPPVRTAQAEYRCLGDGRGGTTADPEVIRLSPVLSRIRSVKRPAKFVLDDFGELVGR